MTGPAPRWLRAYRQVRAGTAPRWGLWTRAHTAAAHRIEQSW